MAAKVVGSDRTFRGKPSLKTVPIRPFLGLLTNFATGPRDEQVQALQGAGLVLEVALAVFRLSLRPALAHDPPVELRSNKIPG
jgi:hypothetical protein